ncbi:MAG: substrate-binding domain-containing protein [Phycisphaerales bacterium JB043]
MSVPATPVFRILAAALALAVASCSQSESREDTPRVDTVEVYAPIELKPLIDSLQTRYLSEANLALYTTAGTQSYLESQAATASSADLVVLVERPEQAFQDQHNWIAERLVIFNHADATQISLGDIASTRGTIASVSQIEPLGMHTRLALRTEGLWAELESRVRLHTSPEDVIEAVVDKDAAFGITLASQVPHQSPLRILADLQLPPNIRVRYVLVPLTDNGRALASWLLEDPIIDLARSMGYTH